MLQDLFEKIKADIGRAQRDARALNINKPSKETIIKILEEKYELERARSDVALHEIREKERIEREVLLEKYGRIEGAVQKAAHRERKVAHKYRKAHPWVSSLKKPKQVDPKVEEELRRKNLMQYMHRRKPGEQEAPSSAMKGFAASRYHQGEYIVEEGADVPQENAIVMAARLAKIQGILDNKRQEMVKEQKDKQTDRFKTAIHKLNREKEHDEMINKLKEMEIQDRKRRQENVKPVTTFGQPQRAKKLNDIFSKTFLLIDPETKKPVQPKPLKQSFLNTAFTAAMGAKASASSGGKERSIEFTAKENKVIVIKPKYGDEN